MPEQSAGTPQSVAAFAQQLPPAIRELHRAVLQGFRDHGQAHRVDLHPTAAALGVDIDDAGPQGWVCARSKSAGRAALLTSGRTRDWGTRDGGAAQMAGV
jgi:hypothetical protein